MKLSINGEMRCVGSIGEFGVLSAIVGWVHRNPEMVHPDIREGADEQNLLRERIDVTFGGLDSTLQKHVTWLRENLKPGDVVSIRVLSEGEYDPPAEMSEPSR